MIEPSQVPGTFTGRVYMKAVPRHGQNSEFKDMIKEKAKVVPIWQEHEKAYSAKMETHKIAESCFQGLIALEGCKDDIGDHFDGSAFDGIENPRVSVFPHDGGTAIHGQTYIFKDDLKGMGFKWLEVNGLNVWFSKDEVEGRLISHTSII